ncbi:MAG TPA: VIT domain-containing protein, partial [Thermoanaerobaculia bacterium]|nr:VIT domain-containing protein [Thermoanaerobaculia bacterium]
MLRTRLVCFIACALVSASLFAERPAIPTLSIDGDDGKVALDLVALQVRVTIRGHLARTEYELTYRNALDRVVGGEFRFPLPADAEVSDLGLYFGGRLRHGVAVERVLARAAYEEIAHRGVDPALAEWGSGRAFKLSVYPIPANGEKKIFIAYDQELTADGYTLDLRYGRPMKFDAAIDADGRAVAVEGSVPMHSDGQVVDGIVRVAREENETAVIAYSPEDKTWYASAAIDVAPSANLLAPTPHVVILYDTSSSSVQQSAPRLRRFLSAFLAQQQAWATADVFPFHIALDTPRRIKNAGMPGGQRDLERVLGELQPLGATNLFAVISQLSAILAPLPPSTRIVLVTDGLTSLGDSRDVAAALRKLSDLRRPLLVVNAASTADDAVLANGARATGGWSIDLTRVDPEAAAANAMRLPADVRFGSGILPGRVVTAGGERVSIAARANDALIRLPHDLPPREIAESGMVRRAWARAKLREMLADGAPDEELVAHGRAFTQLTPRTSLLVLESWQDYELYDIPMPPDVLEEKEREKRQAERQGQTVQLIAFQQPQFTPGSWFIKGHVFTDGDALPGATISLHDAGRLLAATVTDVNGRYLLAHATAPMKPALVAELSGFNRIERQLDPDTPAGTTIDLHMTMSAVSESITVTAEAPFDPAGAESAPAVRPSIRTAVITTDELLNKIAAGTEPESDEDDPEVLDAVRKHRIELTQ